MPTAKPRIFVTLDPELADAIRRIGLGSKMSQSAFIAEILNGQRHALLSLADAMDKARAIQGPLSGALAAVLGRLRSAAQRSRHQPPDAGWNADGPGRAAGRRTVRRQLRLRCLRQEQAVFTKLLLPYLICGYVY